MKFELDETDKLILTTLALEAKITNSDLAKKIGLAPSACHNRVRKLESLGVIEGYQAKLSGMKIDRNLLTFILVRTNRQATASEVATDLSALPNTLEVHQTAGDYCFLVKVRTKDTAELAHLINDEVIKIKGIDSSSTIISLLSHKEQISPSNLQ